MNAVAEKRLPVRPGDYVIFSVTGNRYLVVTAMPQDVLDNRERGYPTTGQHLVGLMTEGTVTSISQVILDWVGFEDFWTIERTTE